MRIKFLIVLLILFLSSTSRGVGAINVDQTRDVTHAVNFGGSTTNGFSNEISLQPDLPDIGSYVSNNISDFSSDGTKDYVGTDIISEISQSFFYITVNLTNIEIYADKDGTFQGANDIFVEGTVNGNYTRFPEIGNEFQLEINENVNTSKILLNSTKATTYNITMEVRESDTADVDDSFGFVRFESTSPTNTTLQLMTDSSEAQLTFNISAIEAGPISADEMLEGNKPYLHIDDETSATQMPDDVVGRVIIGDDKGIQAMVLQYYFYWTSENTPDAFVNFELHKNDFEALYVYYDLSDLNEPYRIVLNNYIYTNIDEFPNNNLLIVEKGASSQTQSYSVDISENLQLLLGLNANFTVDIKPMSDIYDWDYGTVSSADARRNSLLGMKTFDMTVDTSYHTFDFGPAQDIYGFNYTISDLNDSRIHNWYAIIEDTFANGTHFWSEFGIDIPKVGPFTFDVRQVFTAPYIINGYSSVVSDVGIVSKAKNSYLNASQSIEITTSYNFESDLLIQVPQIYEAGTSSVMRVEFVPSDTLEIQISYNYEMEANFSYWFVQTSFDHDFNGTFNIDLNTGVMSSLADGLGVDSYEVENIELGPYLDLSSFVINAKLFGIIVDGHVNLDLLSILDDTISPLHPLASLLMEVINFFVDDFSLDINFIIEGVVTMPISSANSVLSLNTTEITFTEDKLVHFVELQMGTQEVESVTLVIGDLSYGLHYQLIWSLLLGFNSPVSNFVSDQTWEIGTFPDYTQQLLTSPGTTLDIDREIIHSTETADGDLNQKIGIYILSILLVTLVGRNKKRKRS